MTKNTDRIANLENTLAHVVTWLMGDEPADAFKPLPAATANRIAAICGLVLHGKTLADALAATEPAAIPPTPGILLGN